MDPPKEKGVEVDALSRVVANHLFLGQFEALRASLLSLRKRSPELAFEILVAIVSRGGRIDGVLWSPSCSSPSHLAWLSLLELLKFGNAASAGGFDPETLRLRVEFLLLVQLVCSKVQERTPEVKPEDEKGVILDADAVPEKVLDDILHLGLQILRSDFGFCEGLSKALSSVSEDRLITLFKVFLDHAYIFDALCRNIQSQVQLSETSSSRSLKADSTGSEGSIGKELKALVLIQKSVQMAHLDASTRLCEAGDLNGAFRHLRFLNMDYGLEKMQYERVLRDLTKKACNGNSWLDSRNRMMSLYVAVLSSNCIELAQKIQINQDEALSEEINHHVISEDDPIPLPLKKFLLRSNFGNADYLENKTPSSVEIRSCLRDLYHYGRLSGVHILECIMHTALHLIKKEHLEEASYVLSLFPLLQPLAACLGWDLLSGKTAIRRRLMQLLWTSKSQLSKPEQFSFYKKQPDEISCLEHLCNVLCYRLDLANYVACVNSGQSWHMKNSLLFSQNDQVSVENDAAVLDCFEENFILERLAVQTPMRVLFDVVPDINFKDAIELLSMGPIGKQAASKRMQDIELLHMHYALKSSVFALEAMEKYVGYENEAQYSVATLYLQDLQTHMDSIRSAARKVFMVSILSSLLQLDMIGFDFCQEATPRSYDSSLDKHECSPPSENGNMKVASFMGLLLEILHQSLVVMGPEVDMDDSLQTASRQALEWRISNVKHFLEDWEWRLSILRRLQPLSQREWSWKEALVIFRAAPSKLLNICMQRAKYDIGEEAVKRFSLPPEDKAALELAEWVAGAFQKATVEHMVSRFAEGTSNAVQDMNISSYKSQLGPLAAILLCIDAAATSAKSVDMCKILLDQAKSMLLEFSPESPPKTGSAYRDQVHEVATAAVAKRILQRLYDLLELEKPLTLQEILSEEKPITLPREFSREGQRQRAIVMLHNMIEDAHQGKRQFLSGKLHNLARVLTDEDSESNPKEGFYHDKKTLLNSEKGAVVGFGIKTLKSPSVNLAMPESNPEIAGHETKNSGKRFFGSLTSKPSTYLSSFIIYIATIGDIVDGVDTTHEFNFFSLVYERPKDLLTRLVFERNSVEAASKIADIMGVDFVHEVISACVPPVLPPRSGHGWACIPLLPIVNSESKMDSPKTNTYSPLTVSGSSLYPLKLSLVKHLDKLSPVRAVLASFFGSTILFTNSESYFSNNSPSPYGKTPDAERSFRDFAFEHLDRFPTLIRWIQMQSNLHRVSESEIASQSESKLVTIKSERKGSKRIREPESITDSEVDTSVGVHITSTLSDLRTEDQVVSQPSQDSALIDDCEIDSKSFISFDWENEGPYERAVERLIEEGNLIDALALSDRCLREGASDHLLRLLIERGEEKNPVTGSSQNPGARNFRSTTWQYCLRLKDKRLAGTLALKYLHRWDLDPAIDVLTMCICHLPQSNAVWKEALQMKQALQKYQNILNADDYYHYWQEVEADCKDDPEGLALRLASKGAVSAALEVAESASLSIDLRRELQGRQLVKLLTTDPLSGGGPAAASRFLSSLHDSEDAIPVAIGAMKLLPDLRSKQLLVHFVLKRRVGSLSDAEEKRLNSWALGLRVLALLPLPSQQRCSALHEHPQLILEVLLMMKQLQSASLILKEIPELREQTNNVILVYAEKAISVHISSTPRNSRISVSGSRSKQKSKSSMPPRSTLASSFSNLQKEARRAFSWTTRDTSQKTPAKDNKRKNSAVMPSERNTWEAMTGIHEEHVTSDGQERLTLVSVAEEWVLTGDTDKDKEVHANHKYETAPDITLFKALLSLFSSELLSAKGALELCVTQMKNVLSLQNLPMNASMETLSRAYHAAETYVQGLAYAKSVLRKLAGKNDVSSNSEKSTDDASLDTGSLSGNQYPDEISDLISQSDIWLGRAELLQSLLGSGINASLDDIADLESSIRLRDRLILDERYSMAIYTCKKCKIDAFPVWNAWGQALIRMEHYAQARVKFKQALQLYKSDPTPVIHDIINTVEGGPPVDISSIRMMYEHLAISVPTILDDSLSADAYLNVLNMPSTFPRSERSRRSPESSRSRYFLSSSEIEDGPRSNLDSIRYLECIHYLQEFARPQILPFMFKHGHYSDACLLFFPSKSIPSLSQSGSNVSSTTNQRVDNLATDYGAIDDLCALCIDYGAMAVLEDTVKAKITLSSSEDITVSQYLSAAVSRICNYCETHRHFNYLYNFLVIKGDQVAAGLCCIQLFMNSHSREGAIKNLENAKAHFTEGLSARHRTASEPSRSLSKIVRGKSASEKLSEDELIKFSGRVSLQVDIVRALNDTDGPQWKFSLFGNPSEPETFRRRCLVAEVLAERHFDLAFQVIHEFNLPAVDIYAGVAASLAERKKAGQLTEFLKNIKGTIDEDDWDQVLGAAISVYANKHKERPDRLIDMLISSHRKVLACVVCGRLKSAFQIASRSGSVADVEYVAHQASIANALPVVDMCRQWLNQYRFRT